MDIPWYLWVLVLILLAPWIVGGIITAGAFLFFLFAGVLVGVLKLLEPVEARYRRSKFGQWRMGKQRAKRIARAKARRERR